MKQVKLVFRSFFILSALILAGCNDDDDDNSGTNATCSDGIQNGNETDIDCGGPDCQPCAAFGTPQVVTSGTTTVSFDEAEIACSVTNDEGSAVSTRGVVYDTSTNPDLSDDFVSSGSGTGNYSVTIGGLEAGTTYYVKAYATNSNGTAYGNEISFTTNDPPIKVVSAWIDPGDGRLYACASDGEIRRKTTYTGSWSSVDDANYSGQNLQSAWIDSFDGNLYGAASDGTIRRKTSFQWVSESDNNFSEGNLTTVWTDPGSGDLYAAGSDGTIRRKTSFQWVSVDDATFSGEKLTTCWIDPGDGNLYGADADGKIRRKTNYGNSWSSVDDALFSGGDLQSCWIDPGDGKLYGIDGNGTIRSKSNYGNNWSFVDDAPF